MRNAPAEGIAVEVPADATGTIHVSLFDVDILDNRGHGVLVNDQEDPSTPDGVQPNANGSAASVDVSVINSRFVGNGFSVSDRDGLRVNEGGDGDLIITVEHTVAADNAADGIEVDERGRGDVRVDMFGTDARAQRRVRSRGPRRRLRHRRVQRRQHHRHRRVQRRRATTSRKGSTSTRTTPATSGWTCATSRRTATREEGVDYEEDDDFAGGGDIVTTMTAW